MKLGFFTERQIKILYLRNKGLLLRDVAEIMKTSYQNISLIEKRVYRNVKLAKDTILIYRLITSPVKIILPTGSHLAEIPRKVILECDKKGVKLKADFTLIYKLIRFRTSENIRGQYIIKPILLIVDLQGQPYVYDYESVEPYVDEIERIVGEKIIER